MNGPSTEAPPGGEGRAAYRIDAAARQDVGWIAESEARVYSPSDAIPEPVLAEWYDSNPAGFSVLKSGGERIGHINILPLRPAPLRRLLDGAVAERDIRGADLYAPHERDSIKELYVESLAVLPRPGVSSAPAASFVLSNVIPLVGRLCDPGGVENVYALAASGAGEKLMRHLGFVRRAEASARSDGHDLWAARLSDVTPLLSAYVKARRRGPS